jgi:hypothetical protein
VALDIYVGPLVRYYRGDWETVTQRWARESGVPMTVIRSNGEPDTPPPIEEVLDALAGWQDYLRTSLAAHTPEPIAWSEDPAGAYTTDRPGHGPYGALLLWAAYLEHPGLKRPIAVPEDFSADPAYVASNAEGFRSRFGQLLHDVEIWLPGRFAFTFRGGHLGDGDIGMGSCFALLDQLRELNSATWKLSEAARKEVAFAGIEQDATLEAAARFGFAVLEPLAVAATLGPWPMKLDY